MNTIRIRQFATAALTLAATILPVASQAELRSKSGEIVVMEPQNLPEAHKWAVIASSSTPQAAGDPSTIMRWVPRFAPELEKRVRWYKGYRVTSWRVDETYVKVGGRWKYLFDPLTSTVA